MRDVLFIQAFSVASGSCFSLAGNIIYHKRTYLMDDHMRACMRLRFWKALLESVVKRHGLVYNVTTGAVFGKSYFICFGNRSFYAPFLDDNILFQTFLSSHTARHSARLGSWMSKVVWWGSKWSLFQVSDKYCTRPKSCQNPLELSLLLSKGP